MNRFRETGVSMNVMKMRQCGVGPTGARAWAHTVAMGAVERLYLAHNHVGKAGATAKAAELSGPSLKTLQLDSNGIWGRRGAVTLGVALEKWRGHDLSLSK